MLKALADRIRSSTLLRWLIVLATIMLLFIFVLSLFLTNNFESAALSIVDSYDVQSIGNVTATLDSIIKTAKNFCYTQMYDTDIHSLLLQAEPDNFTVIRTLNKLQYAVNYNVFPYIHSIALYSGEADRYYSTTGWYKHIDSAFQDMVQEASSYAGPQVFVRNLPFDSYYQDTKVVTVFTYVFSSDRSGMPQFAIAMNLRADSLLNSINGNDLNGHLILLDEDNALIADSSEGKSYASYLHFMENAILPQDNGSSVVTDENGFKLVYRRVLMNDLGWSLVSLQPYEMLNRQIAIMHRSSTITTLVCSAFAVAVAVLLSSFAVRPIRSIANKARELNEHLPTAEIVPGRRDELAMLSHAFDASAEMLRKYKEYQTGTHSILRESTLKSLMLDNSIYSIHMASGLLQPSKLVDYPEMRILLFMVDDFKDSLAGENEKKYATITSVLSFLRNELTRYCQFDLMYIESGTYAAILDSAGDWTENTVQILHRVKQELGVSMSCCIGRAFESVYDLETQYHDLLNLSKYRTMLPRGSILTSEMYNRRSIPFEYPKKEEQAILDALCKVDSFDSAVLDDYLNILIKSDIDDFAFSISRLITAISKLLENMNFSTANEISLTVNSLLLDVLDCTNIDSCRELLTDVFDSIITQRLQFEGSRHAAIADEAMRYIQVHYMDKDLCLKYIAATQKISPSYLGSLYRKAYQISVSDYIRSIRLEKACELIKNTNLEINQVIERVGFDNATSFYRAFKRKYGVVPLHFRQSAQGTKGSRQHE